MKKVFLCGHTGSANHGCEAIVRSTVKILKASGYRQRCVLLSSAIEQDVQNKLDNVVEIVSYQKSYPDKIIKYINAFGSRIFRNWLAGQKNFHQPLLDRAEQSDVCFNIGGDTYCYGFPVKSVALNRLMNKKSIPTVLWCCSIEKEAITQDIKADLLKYSYIVAREQYTVDNLLESGIPENNIIKCCDPAFHLDIKKTNLPKNFDSGNTIGLNISSMVIKNTNENDIGFQNVICFIDRVLEETECSICLIPHVYDASKMTGDIELIEEVLSYYPANDRISYVDKNLSCEQLKYIISKCKMFVGA